MGNQFQLDFQHQHSSPAFFSNMADTESTPSNMADTEAVLQVDTEIVAKIKDLTVTEVPQDETDTKVASVKETDETEASEEEAAPEAEAAAPEEEAAAETSADAEAGPEDAE